MTNAYTSFMDFIEFSIFLVQELELELELALALALAPGLFWPWVRRANLASLGEPGPAVVGHNASWPDIGRRRLGRCRLDSRGLETSENCEGHRPIAKEIEARISSPEISGKLSHGQAIGRP